MGLGSAMESMKIQSVDRALRVMDLLLDSPRTIAELSEVIGIGHSGMQKILYTLQSHDLVTRQGGVFVLSVGCARYACGYLARQPLQGPDCVEILSSLSQKTGGRVVLASLEAGEQVNLLQVDVGLGARADILPMKVGPAWPQATGQVLLAHAAEETVSAHLQEYPAEKDRLDLAGTASLDERLSTIRAEGYAVVSTAGGEARYAAAGVRNVTGRVIAALGAQLSTKTDDRTQIGWVRDAAGSISLLMGYSQEKTNETEEE